MSEEFLERIRSATDRLETPESINVDSSEELRKANDLALDQSTAESGIQKLEQLITSHPDASDPYCLLAQALSKQKRYQDAERILLDAYDRVKRKSNVADSLGYFYLQETTQKNLPKSIEWYLVSVAAQRTKPSLWAPFLYLSGVYQEYGFTEIASSLRQAANEIRKNPVHLSSDWFRNLRAARNDVDDNSIRFLLEQGWNKGIKPLHAILNQDSLQPGRATQASVNLVCDVCAIPVTGQGKRFSAGQFQALVNYGFQPDAHVTRMMGTRMGVGDAEALHLWRSVLVATNTTDWLLCDSCAQKADRYSRPVPPVQYRDFSWWDVLFEFKKPVLITATVLLIFVFFFALPRWTVRSLSDDNPQDRVQAAMQLASSKLYFLYSRESKLFALTEALRDPEPQVRKAATGALKTMLKAGSSEEKKDVFCGIGLIAAKNPKYSEELIGVMAEMTQDDSVELRRESWNALSNKLASERIPSTDFWMRFCTKFLSHENSEVRSAALGWMPFAGPNLTSAIPLFIKLLKQDPNLKVRCRALSHLLALKDAGKGPIQKNLLSILSLLQEVNGNKSNSMQTNAQLSEDERRKPETALLLIGQPAVPYLEELTKHDSMDIRWRSSELLKEILLPLRWQQSMDPFVPTFNRLMIDPAKNVRGTAVNFFMNLNCNSVAMEALAGQMGNKSSDIRKDISDAFQHYLLPQCLHRFRNWWADQEKEEMEVVRARVGSAITLPLVKLLDHPEHEIRKDAALLLKTAHANGLYPRNWDGLQIMRLEERLTSVLGE